MNRSESALASFGTNDEFNPTCRPVILVVMPLKRHPVRRQWFIDVTRWLHLAVLSKRELARYLIGLVDVDDADLIDQDPLLPPSVCAADDRAAVRRLRDMIQRLYLEFDYHASPEFAALTNGKSDAYRTMLAKLWSDPEKRTQMRTKYADALASLLTDDRAYNLTAPERHKILDNLTAGFEAVMNPDDVA